MTKRFRNSVLCLSIILSLHSSVLFAQVNTLDLDKGWTFHQSDTPDWMEAKVPGCVHTDLLDNKKIPDPYSRANEREVQWVGEKNWEYKSSFTFTKALMEKDHIEMVFKGLDTYADVYLNEQLILSADNMHREWRKDCKEQLKVGENTIRVYFKSVFKVDIPKYLDASFKAQAFPNNDQGDMWISMYARKAGYEYGWDWGPRLITSGIWRPVFIEAWNGSKINSVQLIQHHVDLKKAALSAVFDISSDGQKDAVLTVGYQNEILIKKQVNLVKGINTIQLDYDILKPRLWWSNGLGKPDLYTFQYSLNDSSKQLDSRTITAGLRSLKIIQEKDKDGTSFYVKLNGVPVFVKGSNYIPIDNFLNRVTAERYETVINSAKAANMNMLRVWGGGIYENDIFYDLCDKYGIMVWQDMMFACGMYPAGKAFVDNVKQEVKENITRLRNHPSIALWCGNNENAISWFGWGWKGKYPDSLQKKYESSMHQLFNVEIPAVINAVDTTRFYHPSSPSTGYNGINKNNGDAHYYGVWSSGQPFEAYNTNVARFMSEYGFQSFPEYKSVEQFTAPEDRFLNSPVMFFHQKAKAEVTREDFGNKNIAKYMDAYFKQPKDFKSFLYVSQVQQAKGIITAIEAHRRNMPFCMGTMYWQLNDCWPVASWSGTDYYGRWKALHYAVKKAYQKEIISVVNEQGRLKVYIASDRLEKQKVSLSLKLLDFSGKVISLTQKDIAVLPNTSKLYFEVDTAVLLNGHSAKDLVWLVDLKSSSEALARKEYYFNSEKDLLLGSPKIDLSVIRNGESVWVELKADKLAKAVFLSMPGKEGSFSDNYFDLMPGEVKKVELNTAKGVKVELKDLDCISLIDSYSK